MNETDYLLVCLMEEASEIVKECSKALRFGLNDINPNSNNPDKNRTRISKEILDLEFIAEKLRQKGVIDRFSILKHNELNYVKRDKFKKFMEYSKNQRRLEC